MTALIVHIGGFVSQYLVISKQAQTRVENLSFKALMKYDLFFLLLNK